MKLIIQERTLSTFLQDLPPAEDCWICVELAFGRTKPQWQSWMNPDFDWDKILGWEHLTRSTWKKMPR